MTDITDDLIARTCAKYRQEIVDLQKYEEFYHRIKQIYEKATDGKELVADVACLIAEYEKEKGK